VTGPHPLDEATGDVFLRWHVGADPRARMWRTGQAVAVVVPRGEALGCLAFGDPGQMAVATTEALTSLAAEGVTEVRLSLPPGVETPAAERVADVSRWEWMWISRLSSRQSPEVRWLDPADADLLDLLAQSPRAHARPGDPDVRGWAGVRRSGELVAAGALCSSPPGTPHLRAIVTHPEHRGGGLGAAVTAFLTEAGLRESAVVTLGMYSDNDVARRVYHRLGYTTSHRWVSSHARLAGTVPGS